MNCDLCGKDIFEEGRGIFIKLYYRELCQEGKKYTIAMLCIKCFAILLFKMGISPLSLKHPINAVEELKKEWPEET
jgi:hypothetical protein